MTLHTNSVSTCNLGEEKWEKFYSYILKQNMIQYEFRFANGELFSCTASSLAEARIKRDQYIVKNGKEA
jgi:hypothetical protein